MGDQKGKAEVIIFYNLASDIMYFSYLQYPNDYRGQAYSVWKGTAQVQVPEIRGEVILETD